MSKPYDYVHLVLHAYGGKIEGRTKLQKIVYFVGALTGHPGDLGYRAHFYGPYSSDVSVAADELQGLGFLTKKKSSFGSVDSSGFEVARYDFQLTDDGEIVAKEKAATHATLWERIRKAVQTLKDANAEDYVKKFVIDHEELIEGGKEVLRAGGNLGSALFAAASGMVGLSEVQKQLDRDAEDLF